MIHLDSYPSTCVLTPQPRGPMRMRSGCFERGLALAGDRAPSEDASIKSTDTSSWPHTWGNQPTAHIAEISSGKATQTHISLIWCACCWVSLTPTSCVCDPPGACWGSRDTSVRVSTFLQESNFDHLLFKQENTSGITCCWRTAVIWSQATSAQSHRWPAFLQQHPL